jgi:hypothetical protein
VLAALRWFTEELPELPVIAAGSLLEFALGERARSMPVGRITYCHVEPLGFAEYLAAHDQDRLLDELAGFHPTDLPGGGIPSVVHESASRWYARYAMVGGMPAVVRADVDSGNPAPCRRLQQDLMATFRDDFSRYGTRLDPPILDSTLLAVAAQLGSKFVYSKIGDGVKQHQGRQALELLARARLLTIATHSLANGIPLGGEVRARNQKVLLLDVGLAHALLRTPVASPHPHPMDLAPQVRGRLTEQLAGQQLRALQPGTGEDTLLHYWQNVGGRSGEIDFLTQIAQRVVPVELKSAASGAMKSLHQFIHAKGLDFAVRIDSNPPSLQQVDVKTTGGDRARYRLLNLPGYLVWRVGELATRLLA